MMKAFQTEVPYKRRHGPVNIVLCLVMGAAFGIALIPVLACAVAVLAVLVSIIRGSIALLGL